MQSLNAGGRMRAEERLRGVLMGSLWGSTPSKYLVHLKPIVFMEPIAMFNESTKLKAKLKVLSLE